MATSLANLRQVQKTVTVQVFTTDSGGKHFNILQSIPIALAINSSTEVANSSSTFTMMSSLPEEGTLFFTNPSTGSDVGSFEVGGTITPDKSSVHYHSVMFLDFDHWACISVVPILDLKSTTILYQLELTTHFYVTVVSSSAVNQPVSGKGTVTTTMNVEGMRAAEFINENVEIFLMALSTIHPLISSARCSTSFITGFF